MQVEPSALAKEIDWLFRQATADLAAEVLRKAARVAASAERQRAPYAELNFPKPGEDPELISIVREVLGEHLEASLQPMNGNCSYSVRQYLALENQKEFRRRGIRRCQFA